MLPTGQKIAQSDLATAHQFDLCLDVRIEIVFEVGQVGDVA